MTSDDPGPREMRVRLVFGGITILVTLAALPFGAEPLPLWLGLLCAVFAVGYRAVKRAARRDRETTNYRRRQRGWKT